MKPIQSKKELKRIEQKKNRKRLDYIITSQHQQNMIKREQNEKRELTSTN